MKRAHLVFLVFIVIVVAWCIMSAEEAKTEDYTALFPSPPAGWEASQVTVKEGESML